MNPEQNPDRNRPFSEREIAGMALGALGAIASALLSVVLSQMSMVYTYAAPMLVLILWLSIWVFWSRRQGKLVTRPSNGIAAIAVTSVLIALLVSTLGAFYTHHIPPIPISTITRDPSPNVTATASPTSSVTPGPTATPTAPPPPIAMQCLSGVWTNTASRDSSSGDNAFADVAAVSAQDVWAVGQAKNSGGVFQTLIEQWNGMQWTIVKSPDVGAGANALFGLAVVSPTNIWAVGEYFDTSDITKPGHALIVHWDGSTWKTSTGPSAGTASDLNAIAVVDANSVWATGYQTANSITSALIEHWDGSGWGIVQNPSVPSSNYWLNKVAASSQAGVWASGYYRDPTNVSYLLVEHLTGQGWQIVNGTNAGPNAVLNGMTAVPGTGQLWFVGSSNSNADLLALQWTGSGWNTLSPADTTSHVNMLFGVTATSATDVWALGQNYDTNSGSYQMFLEHWDGSSWSLAIRENFGEGDVRIVGISAIPGSGDSGQVWAAGYETAVINGVKTLRTLALTCSA